MKSMAIIIQARLGSTRLPAKVLRTLGGKSVIQRVIEACQRADVGDVYVAIPHSSENDPLAKEAAKHGAIVSRGPDGDVLTRYVMAAELAKAEHLLRVTSDCPLIDSAVIREVANHSGDQFYHGRTNDPDGTDCERFYWGTLLMANRMSGPDEREHVTTWMRRHHLAPDRASDPATKFSIDTLGDLARCEMLLATVGEAQPWQAYVAKLKETAGG